MTRLIKCLVTREFVDAHDQKTVPAQSDVLYFLDWFDTDFLESITQQYGEPTAIVTDVEGLADCQGLPLHFIPLLQMGVLNWVDMIDQTALTNDPRTTHCFNFFINRKTTDRYLLLKLVEWFELKSYDHTWSGVGDTYDCSFILTEFDSVREHWATSELKNHILTPITGINSVWYEPEKEVDYTGYNRFFGEMSLWKSFIADICNRTAVALITESSTNDRPTFTFTEKTLWPLVCLNFPIWVGNYRQAEQAQRMGFDIFPDVIDHGYQHKKTLIERCYCAVRDNLHLLTDLGLVQHLRNQHLGRLIKNREHMIDGGFRSWALGEIEKLPSDVKQALAVA